MSAAPAARCAPAPCQAQTCTAHLAQGVSGASVSDPSTRLKLELFHPPVEVERKFLVANDDWKRSVTGSVAIRDGLVALYKDRKVRVRIAEGTATITVKGPRRGIRRDEFEYEIPLADAERMLAAICRGAVL